MANLSPAELRAQADALLKQADEQEQAERAKVLQKALDTIRNAGLTVEDLAMFARPPKPVKGTATFEPKFRGPSGETWTGRGHQPQWMKDALAAGKKKEEFAI